MILGVVVAVDAEPRVVEHAPLAWVILARDVDTGLFVEPPRRKAQLVRDGARSSPVSEACHAAAAATARRSKYSRIASATNADRLLPRHGSVEFRTKFVVERYGNADSHIGDTTDDNANSRITDPIGESPCHEDRREWY